MQAMTQNTLCSLSTPQYIEWHFIYVNIQCRKHAPGDDEDVTRDEVILLTLGPYHICQSHTRAVKINGIIYLEKEVTQTEKCEYVETDT